MLEHLKYQVVKGMIVAEISDRTMRVLKGCGVEMLIIDEADRFKSKTFAEVRDIFEKLEIPVMAAIRALNKGLSRIDLETLKLGFGERALIQFQLWNQI